MSTLLLSPNSFTSAPQMIDVYAGDDQTTCINQSLTLNTLNASISGEVNDGLWVRIGDGLFQPGNLTTVGFLYAIQNNIVYVPGNADRNINRQYDLLLVSNPGVSTSARQDMVRISFQSAPPLFCSSNLNISLNEKCTQIVDASMLQPNPVPPLSNYIITLYDPQGKIIPQNTLTKEHIDKEITYRLGHQCTANICWGKFKVEDYFPPVFVCKNDTILCNRAFTPDSLGFPIPIGAKIDTFVNGKYIVSNWDFCSLVTLEYSDVVVKANCVRDEDRTITRKWRATDARGNSSTCDQKIVIKRITLAQVIFPPHYDSHVKPAFECGDTYPTLSNGHPSPDTTGYPNLGSCGNLQFNMTDVKFELCGNTFKIARSWFVIDWCTSESMTRNQIILVRDSKAPIISCVDTLRINTGAYFCNISNFEIPKPEKITDCNIYNLQYQLTNTNNTSANQYITTTNNKHYFHQLPVGKYFLDYIAIDTCNNADTCRTVVDVKDKTGPSVVCDQFTKVAVDGNGKGRVFAFTFDDGSSDNCGIATFKVRKMTDKCDVGTTFGDYVDFCCSEIGSKVMVALEVSDIYGNKNTCMVEVEVEDKLKPVITCPPNITLSCTDNYDFANLQIFGNVVTKASDRKDVLVYNFYHNGKVGIDGLASDNCSVTVSHSYKSNIECHTGTIVRKFVAVDASGLKDSCTQTITILNPKPFNGNDTIQLKWPKNYISEGCRSSSVHPDVTGKPIFSNTACGNVTATYEDLPFYIADSACVKILRTWTVVDWCQFTGTNQSGKWGPHVQLIKLHNSDKPIFSTPCRDTVICSYDTKCLTAFVQLGQIAKDSCTAVSDLVWRYEIDLDNNGSIDSVGNKNDFAGDLPIGKHKIFWKVEDQCGNFNTCTHFITIKDCKKPTPYCLSSLTTSLMQSLGTVETWARDFDNGSTDNCTGIHQLLFTFNSEFPVDSLKDKIHYFKGNGLLSTEAEYKTGKSQKWIPTTKSSGKFFDCSMIPDGKSVKMPLTMSIIDLDGNSDFCTIELILQDNANNCPDLITDGLVKGKILTENGKVPQNTEIRYAGVELLGMRPINNENGSFTIDKLPLNKEYTVTPYLNSNPVEGISTLDLIHIQRHLLDLAPFDSPYKILAADVNASSSVTAADLVELRKLILGLTNNFPKELTSWVFVLKENGFTNPSYPFNYNKQLSTGVLQSDITDADFVAVKIGDVNLSAYNYSDNQVENRASKNDTYQIIARSETIGSTKKWIFTSGSNISALGFQVFLEVNKPQSYIRQNSISFNNKMANAHSVISRNQLKALNYSPIETVWEEGEIIFTFETDSNVEFSDFTWSEKQKSEVYTTGKELDIQLLEHKESLSTPHDFSILTNPVYDRLILVGNSEGLEHNLEYTIINMDGKRIHSSQIYSSGFSQEIDVPLPKTILPGVYLLQLQSGNFSQTLKFILIR